MKPIYATLLLLLLFVFPSLAKNNYEKGYVLNNEGTKIECLIDNLYWLDNPTKIEYKIDDRIIKVSLKELQAFEIYDYGKFERHIVKISIPKQAIEKNELYSWKMDTVFLKVVLKGNPSLYCFQNGYANIYFYQSVSDTIPIQLKYRLSEYNGELKTDFSFRNQLNYLSNGCTKLPKGWMEKIQYNKTELIAAFEKLNKCNNTPTFFYKRKKRIFFVPHMEVTAGVTTDQLEIRSGKNTADFDYNSGSKSGYRIGAAFELESLIYLRKCSILLEPYFQKFSDRQVIRGPQEIKVNMNGVYLNLGFRKYFTVNKKTRFFVEGLVNLHTFYFDPTIKYYYYYSYSKIENTMYDLAVRTFGSFSVGGGIMYDRFGIDLRYVIPHSVTADGDSWSSSFKGFQAMAKISLF